MKRQGGMKRSPVATAGLALLMGKAQFSRTRPAVGVPIREKIEAAK